MRRVRVKIEGLRDPPTAVRVAELGADAIGLVFAPAPRRVTPEQAREIVAALPPAVTTVGVFVNAPADEINRIVEETGIGCVQLHGDEPPGIVAKIHAPCIKAFRVRYENWVEEVATWLGESSMGRLREDANERERSSVRENASVRGFVPSRLTVLLDAYDPALRGGSGKRFNWDLIARARENGEVGEFEVIGPIILAGGLDAACVGEAIRVARPWAVDVASGVESSPGVKDLAKVKAFIEAVRVA